MNSNASHITSISLSELNHKAWNLRYTDRIGAQQLAQEIISVNEPINNLIEYYFAQLTITQLLFWQQNEPSQLLKAIEINSFFEKNNNQLGISRASSICATMYDQFGQYDKAMNSALNAVKHAEIIDNDTNKADCYTILGQIYSRTHDYEKALSVLKNGLIIRQKTKDDKATASSLNLIARNYVLNKQYTEGELYYNDSLLLRQSIKDEDGLPYTFLGLSTLYFEKKEWEKALLFYEKAEQSNLKNDERFKLLCLLGKGKIFIQQNNIQQALNNFNEGLAISLNLKMTSLQAEAYEYLAIAYEKENNLEQALIHYKKYNAVNQELLSYEKINQLKNQQIAFSVESAEKEAEIHRIKNIELKKAFDKIELQHHELEEKNKEIVDSINYAQRIQDAYLPNKELLTKLFPQSFLLYKPKDIVSGDFYWYQNVCNENTTSRFFAACDCTGHGVPGAIMSVICSNALHEVVNKKKIHQPDLILNEVRNYVINIFKKQGETTRKDGMDICLIRIIEENQKTTLQYAGANNPLWIVRKGKPDSENNAKYLNDTHFLIEIKANKQPIGNYDYMTPFTLHEIQLQKDDVIYSFTDGLADQFGGEYGKKLKSKAVKEFLLSIQQQHMPQQYELINNFYEVWKKECGQVDDVCMIGVRI